MTDLESAFATGREIIEERHGSFDHPPQTFETEPGLLDDSMAAHTQSTIPTESIEDRLVFYAAEARPQEITVDQTLVEDDPSKAVKSLVHELFEWHATEKFSASSYVEGHTHVVASYNENSVCREINDRMDEHVCEVDWNSEVDT